MSPAESPPSQPLRLLTPLLVVALTAAVGYLGYRTAQAEQRLTEKLDEIVASSASQARSLELLRVESERNLSGAQAVIAQIRHWAPQLVSSATAQSLLSDARARLLRAVDVAAELPAEDFETMERAFAESEDEEIRRWLLRATVRVDAGKGKQLCADIVRGVRHQPSGLLRVRASDVLLELDAGVAGKALHDVLSLESTRGLDRDRVAPSHQKDYPEFAYGERFPQYLNLISRFTKSEYPDIPGTLNMLLRSNEHDRLTYQEVVKELGKYEADAESAVPRIKSLLEKPPFGFHHAIFESHCLQALADIQGSKAKAYLEERLAQPGNEPLVEQKLQALIKEI